MNGWKKCLRGRTLAFLTIHLAESETRNYISASLPFFACLSVSHFPSLSFSLSFLGNETRRFAAVRAVSNHATHCSDYGSETGDLLASRKVKPHRSIPRACWRHSMILKRSARPVSRKSPMTQRPLYGPPSLFCNVTSLLGVRSSRTPRFVLSVMRTTMSLFLSNNQLRRYQAR